MTTATLVVEVQAEGGASVGRLVRRLHGLDGQLERAWGRGTDAAIAQVRNATERLVVERTGMDATVAARITESSVSMAGAGRWVGRVGFSRPRPYTIKPRSKRALAFRWPARGPGPGEGGRWAFASVRHPGSRPYRLIQRAASRQWPRIQAGYTREVDDVLRVLR